MDLTTRKKRFIEEFEKIGKEDKIARLEEFLSKEINSEQPVAYTIDGIEIDSESYKKRNQQALESYYKGDTKTTVQILKKYGLGKR